MKQAKASVEEAEELLRWLQKRDANKFENTKDRPPAFSRVLHGYLVLLENCCDPAKDYLDFKPGHSPADFAALTAANAEMKNALTRANIAFAVIARKADGTAAGDMAFEEYQASRQALHQSAPRAGE